MTHGFQYRLLLARVVARLSCLFPSEILVASAQRMLQSIGVYLHSGIESYYQDRIDDAKSDEEKAKAVRDMTIFQDNLTEGSVTGAIVRMVSSWMSGQPDSVQEDRYAAIFDQMLAWRDGFFDFLSEFDLEENGVGYLVNGLKRRIRAAATDGMRKYMVRESVHFPEGEDGEGGIENVEGEKVTPVVRDENVMDSIKDVWGDTESALKRDKRNFIDDMVDSFQSAFPRSALSGYDSEKKEVTDAKEKQARKQWDKIVDEVIRMIGQDVLRKEKPISYTKIRRKITTMIGERKAEGSFIKNKFVIWVVEAIKDEIPSQHDKRRSQAILYFFEGVRRKYLRKLQEMKGVSRRKGAVELDEGFVDPEEMVSSLRRRRADHNEDDKEQYVDHLFDETTDNQDSTGRGNAFVLKPYRVYNLAKQIVEESVDE